MQCGGYGQVGRPTDAGREGGRRAVVHAFAASLQESADQFSVPDGSEPGAGGRSSSGSFFESVPRERRLCSQREVHDLVVPDRDKPGAEFRARQPLSAHGNLTGCAGDGGCRGWRREDAGRCRAAPEHRAAPGGRNAAQDDPARDRKVTGEAARGGAVAQVSGAGLRRDFEDFGMLGERAEIATIPGLRDAASGTGPPRGAAWKVGKVGLEGKEVMSCSRMENKIMAFVDGRLKEGERLEMEKHLATCATCQLRVNEFRSVHALLDELPMIEPSAAFDLRVHARVAAEPVKQSWWAWFAPSPRVAFAASMLLLATVWIGSRKPENTLSAGDIEKINQNISALEKYDVISDFAPLSELPPPVLADEAIDTNQNQQM